MTLNPPSRDEQIRCITRELNRRRRFYPHWVNTGRISQEEADREIELMQAVLATLRQGTKSTTEE